MYYFKIADFFANIDFDIQLEKLIISNSLSDMQLKINDEIIYADVRKEVRPQHISMFEFKTKKEKPFLVAADYITPNAKKLLKGKGINYIDGFGNASIKLDNLKVYVEQGNAKPIYNPYSEVFTQAGGQVLFQLLQHPKNINLTQRKLAEISRVSLGSVSKTIKGLFKEGFTVEWKSDKKFQLVKKEELLDKWVILVNEKILPHYKIGRFSFGSKEKFVRKEEDTSHETIWGGESGAKMLTGYLNPEQFSLFTTRSKKYIMTNYRLVPNDSGEITVYQLFWQPGSSNFQCKNGSIIAHPLLIYAELMYSGNERNIETAQIIYNEYIKTNI